MSSEMRYSDDDLCVIVQDWSESDPDQAVAINLARECLRHRALLARTEAGAVEKRAPVQRYHGKTIPWRVHGLAWEAYAKKYGSSQSAERIAERGGFGVGEMDEFLPGWREMAEGTHPQDASGDAERYRWLRTGLYSENIEIGEAELVLRCYGAAPTLEQFDAAIDSAMQAKEAK